MEFNLSEINSLSNTTKAFVSNDLGLKSLLGDNNNYYSIEGAIEGKNNFEQVKRDVLVDALWEDYQFLKDDGESELLKTNIKLLKESNTFTISTGQQLHLFLGPAFVIHKILAVIKLSEELKLKYPNKNFVPIYWLASEDHDFKEIEKTNLFGKSFPWKTSQSGACGRFKVNEVAELIEEIKSQVNLNDDNLSLLNAFSNIYKDSKNLSEASIRIAHHIFGKMGLVCLDADKKNLKSLFIDVIKNDVINQSNIKPFEDLSNQLSQAGYHTQLHCRDINFFYIKGNLRNRIVIENQIYKVLDTELKFTEKELLDHINTAPENFSPNAVLRPLYQETILPNVAYIGGNAEINYWIQISNVFNINNLSKPTLLLRPSVWIIPIKTLEWLKKANISGLDLLISQNPEKHLITLGASPIDLKTEIEAFSTLKKKIQDTVNQIDKSEFIQLVDLGKLYEKTIKNAAKLMLEIEKTKVDNSLKKLDDIYSNYFDIKQMQERNTSSLEMLIKSSNVAFLLKKGLELKPETGYITSI